MSGDISMYAESNPANHGPAHAAPAHAAPAHAAPSLSVSDEQSDAGVSASSVASHPFQSHIIAIRASLETLTTHFAEQSANLASQHSDVAAQARDGQEQTHLVKQITEGIKLLDLALRAEFRTIDVRNQRGIERVERTLVEQGNEIAARDANSRQALNTFITYVMLRIPDDPLPSKAGGGGGAGAGAGPAA